MLVTEDNTSPTVEAIFSRPAHLRWYNEKIAGAALDAKAAARDFIARAAAYDVTPVRFFDPVWYRANYPVNGANAFLDYLRDGRRRFARPSPLFEPRWYAWRYGLAQSEKHFFLDYLLNEEERDPHPLLDVHYLKSQMLSWRTESVALEYLDDPGKFRLKPHPLFDAGWYLDQNPDVWEARLNPLEHYIRFGSMEGRKPNRSFKLPPHTLLVSCWRIAIMCAPKCASTKLLYWWLAQQNLLEVAAQFSKWPHEFEINYRTTEEFILSALQFEPSSYTTYKFVRNPVTRTVSSFAHLLCYSDGFNFAKDEGALSFMGFLDMLEQTNYLGDPHFVPQQTILEQEKRIRPEILKIEAGLDSQLRAIESKHSLPHPELLAFPGVSEILQAHSNAKGTLEAGPDEKIPFGKIPKYRNLLTPESIARIAQIYACDFEAYGYDPEADF